MGVDLITAAAQRQVNQDLALQLAQMRVNLTPQPPRRRRRWLNNRKSSSG